MHCVQENCAHGWNSHIITYHSCGNCEYIKTEVHKQLHVEEDNPLSEPIPDGSIRFINLPANNMKWAEDLIHRYYIANGNEGRQDEILTREFWKGLQSTNRGPVHARFLRPTCGRVPFDSCLSGEESINKHSDFFLFIPYLHWETDSERERMAGLVTELSNGKPRKFTDDPSREELLYRQHLYDDPPLHVRRTLDQYFYPTLKDTSKRDRDQVVYRATHRDSFGPRIIMVDQLWLWVLDGHTVLGSFPRRSGKHAKDTSGINKNLRDNIPKGRFNSALDLAIAVIDQCSRVFFDRTQPEDNRPEMMEMFADEIGLVTDKLTTAYDEFWRLTEEDSNTHQDFLGDMLETLEKEIHPVPESRYTLKSVFRSNLETLLQPIYERPTGQELRKRLRRQQLLDINPEGSLSCKIKDVLDELNMIKKVYSEQEMVVEEFADLLRIDNSQGSHVLIDAQSKANDLVKKIKKRIAEINVLIDRADHTSVGLKELLDLKQMQANVSEARESHELAKEAKLQTLQAIKQNRALFLFTVVTIVFLPLGFFASVFGMNTRENHQGEMSIKTQFAIMFPASVVMITLSFTLAFSTGVSFFCVMAIRILWACFLKITGILYLWNHFGIKDWKKLERWEKETLKGIYGGKRPVKYDV